MLNPIIQVEMAAMKSRVATLRHEAGHLIVAKLLGFVTGPITLNPNQASAEIQLNPSIPDIDTAKRYIENRIKVLYAGSMAESLDRNKPSDTQTNSYLATTATNDFAKIREHLKILTGMMHPNCTVDDFQSFLSSLNDRIYHEAMALVEFNSKAIVDLSLDIHSRYEAALKAKTTSAETYTLETEQVDAFLASRLAAPTT